MTEEIWLDEIGLHFAKLPFKGACEKEISFFSLKSIVISLNFTE